MDDATFARFLTARGRLPQALLVEVFQSLPPGVRLGQALVSAGHLSEGEARALWAEAEEASPNLAAQTQRPPTLSESSDVSGGFPGLGGVVAERYRLESELGEGGMGAVYRATDLQTSRPVALKLILPGLADAVSLQRFEREAQLGARVDHTSGVVRVYDYGTHQGMPYCAMELVEGRDLAKVFEEDDPLDAARLVALLAPVADTLAICHAEGIVHRDLKPANILVTPEDVTKLADFGLAQDTTLERLTQEGDLLGTPSYMAPEQADSTAPVDGLADVYALGAVLYCGLAGRPPFEGQVHSVIKNLLMTEPARPSQVREGISPDLEAICLQAIAKDPAARYSSAAAFAADLRRAAAGEPVLARPQSSWSRFWSRYRRGVGRTRTRVHASVFLSFALVISGGFLGLRSVAISRAASYEVWAKEHLQPYAYGIGTGVGRQPSRPTFTRDELTVWEGKLAWSEPFTGKGTRALATIRAHDQLLRFVEGAPAPEGEPNTPEGRVARAAIELARAESLDAGGARRGRRHRQRAVTWVEAKSLSAGDELTQKIGARLRLRLELYDPEQEAKDRLRLAAERIEAEPLLAAEAQEAATLALADCLTKILVAKTPDPNAAHHLRKLAMECGGQVLELGTAQAFEQGATEWILAFTDARSPHLRVAMLNTLASVRGHGDRAVQPGPRYVRAFFAAVSTGEAVERMVVTAIWDGVVPGFRPPASFYAVFLGLAMRPDTFDLESLLFSLRALPGSGSHIAIAPSLRGALDRFEDPGGPRAPLSERYKRFVLHFGALTKQHRYKRSRGMRLMQLVAMQRARYHADPKLIDQYVGLARVICDRSGQSSLVDDLSEPWQALALLKLAEGLGELAKFTRDRLQDPSLATSERDRLKRKLEAVIKEGLKAGQAAEGRVLAQRAAAPFSAQAEFSTDGNVRLAIWTRAAEALRKGLAEAHAANHLVMHYEDGLATILRRGARELLGLGRYDEALAWAEECAEVARKAAGIKRNESLNSAVGIMAQVYRRRGELDKAEQALSERLETGLETDDFAFVAAQVAWERGDHEEAIRRAARGLKENFRNRGLTQLLEKYKAKLAELRKREDEK